MSNLFELTTLFDATQDLTTKFNIPIPNVKTWIFDPPYNVGYKYDSYNDSIPFDEYKEEIRLMCKNMADFTDEGNLFMINYQEQSARLFETILSTGWEFKQWITWVYPSNIGMTPNKFTRASRAIVWFTKGKPEFYPQASVRPYKDPSDYRVKQQIAKGKKGCTHYDWWEINLQKNTGKSFAGYSNQLPIELVKRIILTTTKENELVGDLTAGSGTTGKVARNLTRSYWINDFNPKAVNYWGLLNV